MATGKTLTRADLLVHGFAVAEGSSGHIYRHSCGLEVSIPTYPEFDDHEREPWWWGMGWRNGTLPRQLNPKTVDGLRHLLALADTSSQTGVQTGEDDGRKD